MSEFGGGKFSGAAAQGTVAPFAYYIIKRVAVGPKENPFEVSGAYHVPFSAFIFKPSGAFELPDTWKTGVITPPQGGFADSFVDILINNGSDPGDAFKSVLSISGGKIIHSFLSKLMGREIPTGGILVTEKDERAYQMGPAIVAVGVAVDDCPSCSAHINGKVFGFSTPEQIPVFGSVVEDTNALRDGSTAILFGHHVDFDFSDGVKMNLLEARRQHKDCYETCPLMNNSVAEVLFGKDPARAMFIASYAQSLSALAGWVGIALSGAGMSMIMSECGECVDTVGGYYLHMRAPPQKDSQQVFELTAKDALSGILDFASQIAGGVSEELNRQIQAFKQRVEAEQIRNQGVYVQLHASGADPSTLIVPKIIELFMKPKQSVPTSISSSGSIAAESPDGRRIVVNKELGAVSIDGKTVVAKPELVRLTYIDNRVPGIVVPAWLIVTEFSSDPAFTLTGQGYVINDVEFLKCFADHLPDSEASTEFFESVMGKVRLVTTTEGFVDIGNRIVATGADWSGYVSQLSIGSDYRVRLLASTIHMAEDGNTISVDVRTKERDFGTLVSIIFENGAIYYYNGRLYVHVRTVTSFAGNYVQNVNMSPNEDGNALDVSFTPTPDAPKDVVDQIERTNEIIKDMGGIDSIVAEDAAGSIVDGPDGQKHLRIIESTGQAPPSTVEEAAQQLEQVLQGTPGAAFQTSDGSVQIFTQDGKTYITYIDPRDGRQHTAQIISYDRQGNSFTIKTPEGEHHITITQQDGKVVAIHDGATASPVASAPSSPSQAAQQLEQVLQGTPGAAFQTSDGSVQIFTQDGKTYITYIDPRDGRQHTAQIISYDRQGNSFTIKTPEGEHHITITQQDGKVVAIHDGATASPVAAPAKVREERIVEMQKDDKTGAIIVKTEEGNHTIKVTVDSNGTPQLLLDGVVKGMVKALQGQKGFVTYNPDTGEWSFVAGLLTPLAEAFKNGIKISVDAGGNVTASPAQWSFRPNPYRDYGASGGGFSLPLLEGPEIVLLLVAVAAIFAIIR